MRWISLVAFVCCLVGCGDGRRGSSSSHSEGGTAHGSGAVCLESPLIPVCLENPDPTTPDGNTHVARCGTGWICRDERGLHSEESGALSTYCDPMGQPACAGDFAGTTPTCVEIITCR